MCGLEVKLVALDGAGENPVAWRDLRTRGTKVVRCANLSRPTMTARDLVYGRRGGRWSESSGIVDGPPCEECGRPMTAGQKRYHGVCSPLLECGHRSALVGDVVKHLREEREVAEEARAARARRGRP